MVRGVSFFVGVLAFLNLPSTAGAQEGTPSRPSLDCAKYPNCDNAQWEMNKQGYALLVSLPTVESYLVCMAHVANTERFYAAYLKVDNKILGAGSGSLGSPLVSGGCSTVQGKVIEVVNRSGAPISRVQGFYRRLSAAKPFALAYPWNAAPSGVAGQPGDRTQIYSGAATSLARLCFAGDDAVTSKWWASQRNLLVNDLPLKRGDGTTAVFSRHTCVDVTGVTSAAAWRDFDANEAWPVGGSMMFAP